MYFFVQSIDSQRLRHLESNEHMLYKNLIKLVEVWMMNAFTPEKNAHLDPKSVVSKFYLGCYLMCFYQLHNYDLNIKLINMIEESIEIILKKKYFQLDNTTYVHQAFELEIRQSLFNFIFKEVLLSKQNDKILTLLTIYHGINNMQEHSIYLHEELEYGDNIYWGFPDNVTIYFQNVISIDSIKKALNLAKYDKVLPYTVLIYSLNENNVNVIYESFIKDTQHFPLSALMAAILFRIQHTQQRDISRDNKLRTEVMKVLTIAFTKDSTKLDVHDINRLTKLTLVLTFILPIQYFNQEQFKLCMTLLSQCLNYCDSHLPDNPPIPFEKMTEFFNSYVKKWFLDRILKDRMYYCDLLDEIKFWEETVTKYPFPTKFNWLEIIENFLVTRFRNPCISHQFIIDVFIHIHTKLCYSPLLQEIFLKELTSRLQTIRSGDKNEFVRQLYLQLSLTGQLKKVNNIFSEILPGFYTP